MEKPNIDGATKSLAANFADWEGDVFGFGYGTGEPRIIPALRTFFVCCRGDSGAYSHETISEALGPLSAWLMLNTMGHADIISYGTSPRFGWLTDKGKALRQFVLSHTDDELLSMLQREGDDPGPCYPRTCNCGPDGYEAGRVCINPFWQNDAARKYLTTK